MDATIKTDAVEVMKKFKEFSVKEMRRATRAALRRGAGIIARKAKKNFKIALPAAMHKNPKYIDRLIDAIKYKPPKKADYVKVHTMGFSKRGSGTFRARFFNAGTKQRITKTGENRGKIKPLYFFSRAIDSTSQSEVQRAMEEKLLKTIEKINDANINGKK